MLKLLADENIAHDIVTRLPGQGGEVLHAADTLTQEIDTVTAFP